ncbi:MAG TPA: PH domain-containing protein [Actinomycetota bacterium]|nr:PH domain-containing protein [Actinomycetota bacterium]
MPYPKKLLNPGEQLSFDLHPHWWYFSGIAVVGVVLLAAGVAIPLVFSKTAEQVLGLADAGLGVVWLIWLGAKVLAWRTTHFVLTSDRLIFRSGVLGRQGREIPLERVNDISFHQSLFERIVGTGDLLIESAGRQGQDVFSRLPHPDRAQQAIYTEMENNRHRYEGGGAAQTPAQPAPAAPAEETIAQQIADLARLHDQGVLSDTEFQSKKAELLNRM